MIYTKKNLKEILKRNRSSGLCYKKEKTSTEFVEKFQCILASEAIVPNRSAQYQKIPS